MTQGFHSRTAKIKLISSQIRRYKPLKYTPCTNSNVELFKCPSAHECTDVSWNTRAIEKHPTTENTEHSYKDAQMQNYYA